MTDQRILDFIGDVHGCGQTLGRLLRKLGYRFEGGSYRHPDRRAVFIGDLFDRGPRVRLSTQMARAMVDADQADWILGNHELDVMSLVLEGGSIRPMTKRAQRQTQATFADFSHDDLLALCEWLRDCPLWIDSPGWRAVHACWDDGSVASLKSRLGGAAPGRHFEQLYSVTGELDPSAQVLLRGPSLPLPNGRGMLGQDGVQRKSFRVAFWIDEPDTLGELVFQPDPLPADLDRQPLAPHSTAGLPHYSIDHPPLFFGHYWRRGRPAKVADNLVCLDYSAVLREKLVCYSHIPGEPLSDDRFTWVDAAGEWQ